MRHSILLISCCLTTSLFSQNPSPRHFEEVAYDTHRNVLVLYGGSQYKESKWDEPTFVSEWNGVQWKSINAAGAGSRRAHALVYDIDKKIVVAFGGVMENNEKKNIELFDIWGWDGSGWKKLNNNCPLHEPEAAYNVTDKSILVYGHTGAYDIYELWEYKNNQWKKLSGNGPKPDGPYEVAYHALRNSFIVPASQGGKLTLWEWKNNQWNEFKNQSSFPSPDERNRFGLAYHQQENVIYLFGGRNNKNPFLNDLWKWDGKKWSSIRTKTSPLKRAAHLLEYGDGKLILYGGTIERPDDKNKAGLSNEIWYFENQDWKKVTGDWIKL